jgi:hypothetical protein
MGEILSSQDFVQGTYVIKNPSLIQVGILGLDGKI